MEQFEVVLYEDENGDSQIKVWLKKLQRDNPTLRAKAARMIEKLEALGPELKMPHCKHIGGPIWELRHVDGIRIYYWRQDATQFVAIAGEVKNRDEADSALIQYALDAHKEYSEE